MSDYTLRDKIEDAIREGFIAHGDFDVHVAFEALMNVPEIAVINPVCGSCPTCGGPDQAFEDGRQLGRIETAMDFLQ